MWPLIQYSRLLVESPDMTAHSAAQKPMLDARWFRAGQHPSLNIPTLLAYKRSGGHVELHIDVKIGTHDKQPFFRVVKAARHVRRTERSGGQQSEGDGRGYDVG
jgi:hypothetical protein